MCATIADAPELNSDKMAGDRYDVRSSTIKIALASALLEKSPSG
jgi:hypothetical protein